MVEKGTIGILSLGIAIFVMVISFASPYWVESFSRADSKFVKCGLWEFCFNDYTFYKDYNGNRYLGCWYIFSDQYRPLWEWLSPPWFIACQVMISVALLFQVLVFLMAMLGYWNVSLVYRQKEFIYLGTSAVSLLCTVLILIVLILFGVRKESRGWMPRPDQNYLSWSYGMAVISAVFSLVSALFFFKGSRDDIKDFEY